MRVLAIRPVADRSGEGWATGAILDTNINDRDILSNRKLLQTKEDPPGGESSIRLSLENGLCYWHGAGGVNEMYR